MRSVIPRTIVEREENKKFSGKSEVDFIRIYMLENETWENNLCIDAYTHLSGAT